MSYDNHDGDLNPVATAGFQMAGASVRLMGVFLPFASHIMREAAMARHAMVVLATYGNGETGDRMMKQHELYVQAFYGY